eukprot:scaffold104638_cov69-Phaeocystis_antarctica.AAC.4
MHAVSPCGIPHSVRRQLPVRIGALGTLYRLYCAGRLSRRCRHRRRLRASRRLRSIHLDTLTLRAAPRSELRLPPPLLAAAPVAQYGVACLRGLAVVIRQLSPGQGQLHLRIGAETASVRDVCVCS